MTEQVKCSSGTANLVVFMWSASFTIDIYTSHGFLSYFPIMSPSFSLSLSQPTSFLFLFHKNILTHSVSCMFPLPPFVMANIQKRKIA